MRDASDTVALASPSEFDLLIERVAALKHDLGKYVAWASANLDDGTWKRLPVSDELMAALRADLLETRKHADRRETAWEVWQGFRAELSGELEPELVAVADAVAVLEGIGPALRANDRDALAGELDNIRAAQQEIRNQLRDLHRRLVRER